VILIAVVRHLDETIRMNHVPYLGTHGATERIIRSSEAINISQEQSEFS
jgi:hypothetical protein